MIALYLDENISPLLAVLLRREKYDVTSAHEVDMQGRSDVAQLEYAASHGRAILTFDVKHFCRLHQEWWLSQRPHSGIVVSPEYRTGQIAEVTRLVRNLMAQNNPNDLDNQLVFLQQYS